jgi:hypothetical protein
MNNSHYRALLEAVCCCEQPPGCDFACLYISLDGVTWTFVSNDPEPDCTDSPDCRCTAPDIAPECVGQTAACICLGVSESDEGGLPCNYQICGESNPS